MGKPKTVRKAKSQAFKESLAIAGGHKAAKKAIAGNEEATALRLSRGFDRDAYDFTGYSDSEIARAYDGEKFGDTDYARLQGIKKEGGKKEYTPTKHKGVHSQGFLDSLATAGGHKDARKTIAGSKEGTAHRLSSGFDRDEYDFTGYSDDQIVMAYQGERFGDADYERLKKMNASGGGDKGGAKGKAQDLKDKYVDEINTGVRGPNVAQDTGDISIGGSNYGTANTGVIDYSVNISGGKDGSLNNMKSAQAYGALNENAYERSRSKVTGIGRAGLAVDAAESRVGAKDRISGLDKQTTNQSNYYRDLAKKQGVMTFGDYFSPNYSLPEFRSPEDPEKIEVQGL